ncbi:hypothetical protein GTP46_16220 [Duganella sp. FT135W]|uniref:Uncharacterized protein n=1 Tax=Duganella flavida TaxID=2692175 RepID=A0A6L8K9N9_9BURK|nr:hypothetical protein [Duganella flavida]MYM24193.1 hypothetical protein [Duganella flavida]
MEVGISRLLQKMPDALKNQFHIRMFASETAALRPLPGIRCIAVDTARGR